MKFRVKNYFNTHLQSNKSPDQLINQSVDALIRQITLLTNSITTLSILNTLNICWLKYKSSVAYINVYFHTISVLIHWKLITTTHLYYLKSWISRIPRVEENPNRWYIEHLRTDLWSASNWWWCLSPKHRGDSKYKIKKHTHITGVVYVCVG